MKKFTHIFTYLLLVLILIGCQHKSKDEYTPTILTYESLCKLSNEKLSDMTEDDLITWVKENTEYQPEMMLGADEGIITHSYTWGPDHDNNAPYGIAAVRDGNVIDMSFQNMENGPTFGDVVASFGTPLSISRMLYEQTMTLVLGLEYPSLGLAVYTVEKTDRRNLIHNGELAVFMHQDMAATVVSCFPITTSMEARLSTHGYDSATITSFMEQRIPWSGFDVLIPLDNTP